MVTEFIYFFNNMHPRICFSLSLVCDLCKSVERKNFGVRFKKMRAITVNVCVCVLLSQKEYIIIWRVR